MPTSFREELGENFTISLSSDLRTIALYPAAVWNETCAMLSRISPIDRRAKSYVRYVLGNSFKNCNLDGQGRILIPQTMRSMFDLNDPKEVLFLGTGECLELWNAEKYQGLKPVPDEEADDVLDYIYERYFRIEPTAQ